MANWKMNISNGEEYLSVVHFRRLDHFLLAVLRKELEGHMATLDRYTIARDLMVARIEEILDTDLDFLSKLSSEELGILATSLEELIGCPENHIAIDSCSFHC